MPLRDGSAHQVLGKYAGKPAEYRGLRLRDDWLPPPRWLNPPDLEGEWIVKSEVRGCFGRFEYLGLGDLRASSLKGGKQIPPNYHWSGTSSSFGATASDLIE